jgi:hypothetical protein
VRHVSEEPAYRRVYGHCPENLRAPFKAAKHAMKHHST